MEERMIDITYCYLEDTMGDDWEKKYSSRKFKDPDRYSKRLYKDLMYIWENLPHDERYSPDFIGANRTQAHCIGLDDKEIAKYLKTQRTIGGHILFPVLPYVSINQARGRNMLDRFDFTLAELREYFLYLYIEEKDKTPYEARYSIQLGNAFEAEKNRTWFAYFCKEKKSGEEAFKAFIDCFCLNEFVDCEYKVLSLVCSDLRNGAKEPIGEEEAYFPGFPQRCRVVHVPTIQKRFEAMEQSEKKEVQEAYRCYIQNTSYAIEQRKIAIKDKLKER